MPKGTTGNVRRFGPSPEQIGDFMMGGGGRSSGGSRRIGGRGSESSGNNPDVPFRGGDVYHLTLPQLFYTLGAIQQTVDSITLPDDE